MVLIKELRWLWRSYRITALIAIFLILGFGSPLLLHFLPDLIESAGDDIVVTLPEFTGGDAVAEFLSNLVQMGAVGVILITMGAVAEERTTGTAVFTLSKPVGFIQFVLAKYIALLALVGAATIAGAAVAFLYASVLFDAPPGPEFVVAVAMTLLLLAVLMAITLIGSCVSQSQIVAGAIGVGGLIIFSVFGVLPVISEISPFGLSDWSASLVRGDDPDPVWLALGLSIIIAVLAPIAGARILATHEL